MNAVVEWFRGRDRRGLAHRSLIRDWIPNNPDYATELDSFAYGDTPPGLIEECLDWGGPFRRFLDLGCGCGLPTLLASRRGEAWGYDLLPGVIEMARRAAAELELPARFEVEDIRRANLLEADLVYLAAVRFTPATLKALARNLRQLPPQSRLLSVGHSFAGPDFDLVEKRTRRFAWGEGEDPGDYVFYLHQRKARPSP